MGKIVHLNKRRRSNRKLTWDRAKKCNGYLKFLKDFQHIFTQLSALQIIIEGARIWNCLSTTEKQKIIKMGHVTIKPNYERKSKKPKNIKKKNKPGKRKTKQKINGAKKPQIPKHNGFFLFLNSFKKNNSKLNMSDLIRKAAAKWRSVSERERNRFRLEAARQMAKFKTKKKLSKNCRK